MIICYLPAMLGKCYNNTMKTNPTPRGDGEKED